MILFMTGMSVAGYIYITKSLYDELQETTIIKLEQAANRLDMRLSEVMQLLEALANAGSADHQILVLKQLQEQPEVSRVRLTRHKELTTQRVARVSPPEYFYLSDEETVVLRSDLLGEAGNVLGQIEVFLRLDYLAKDLFTHRWMQKYTVYLVNSTGKILAHINPGMKNKNYQGETENPLESAMLAKMKGRPSGTIVGKGQVIAFYRLREEAPWAIILQAQDSQILAPIQWVRFYYLGGCLIFLALSLALIHLGVGPIVSAIQRMSQKAGEVAQGEYGEPLPVFTEDETGQLTRSFNDMIAGLKERDFIRNTFGRYMDREIAQELLRRPEAARLGGEKREVAILFSDIRGFTPLAETLTPEATIRLVNHHFSRMIEVIQQHRGIIVDFLGDAILAFFDPLDGHLTPVVRQAVHCGLKMQEVLEADNILQPKSLVLQMGVGLHVGEVVVGNIGSEARAKYGIVGSAVNLTHRIQGQAKGGEVVISEPTYQKAGPGLAVQKTFETRLKGIQEPLTMYVLENISGGP
ncbi:MAG: adenylate/guanylate cyclase domain-containing protein [Desulfobaccales bacterium]